MRAPPAGRPRYLHTAAQKVFAHDPRAYRSGLEERQAERMRAHGVPVNFESIRIPYLVPEKVHHYTPDFILPNGVVIETTGLFQTADRQKHLLFKKLYPCLDIRLVFQNANAPIAPKSHTNYGMWATKAGIPWAHKEIPTDWFKESPNKASLAVLASLGFPRAAA